jgi:hypothetical protein
MSATTSRRISRLNSSKLAAIAIQIASYVTTYWAVEWIAQPTTDQQRALVAIIALVAEFVLVRMKSALFDADDGNDVVGWVGFGADSIINAGGILPQAPRILTWPPFATLLAGVGVDVADARTQQIGAFIVAVGIGMLISFAPHRLWQRGQRKKETNE